MTRRFTLTGLLGLSTLCGSAALLALSPILTGCGGGGSSANTSPNYPTRIVFVADRPTNNTTKVIYSLDVPANTPISSIDLSGATPLTGAAGVFDQAPAVSPANSNLIVFQSNRPYPGSATLNSIWKLDTSGSGPVTTQLTNVPLADDTDPVWSHDGKKVAFTRLSGGQRDVYVLDMTTSTTVLRQITTNLSDDKDPTWSANDLRIAFSSNRSGDFDIYTVDDVASESALSSVLTTNPGPDEHPQWSPDGLSILYQGKGIVAGDKWTVYSMPLAGVSAGQTTHTAFNSDDCQYPRYSPDQKHIVYFSFNNNRQIKCKKVTDAASPVGITLSGPNASILSSGDSQPFWEKL
jgi:Tol biopolymer transport system component